MGDFARVPQKCKSLPEDRQGSAERMTDGEWDPFGGPSWTCTSIEMRIAVAGKISLWARPRADSGIRT